MTNTADAMPTLVNVEHTVGFSRTKNLGNYEKAEATCFLKVDGLPSDSLEEIVQKVMRAFVAAKAAVLDQLGIEYDMGEDGFTVEERVVAPPATQQDSVTKVRAAFGGGEVVENGGDHTVDVTSMSPAEQKRWLKAELERNPTAFWDNREGKKNPKAPDFKHKKTGLGLWL